MGRTKWWCHFVIDNDMTVDDVPHQVVFCGVNLAPGERFCEKHLAAVPSPEPSGDTQ